MLVLTAVLSCVLAGQNTVALDQAASLLRAGNTAAAVTVLRKHVAQAPGSAEGHALLGIALFELLHIREAGLELERALALDPRRSDAGEALARLRLLKGESSKAVALLRPFVNEPGAGDDLRLLYARALVAAGDDLSAVPILEKLLQAKPRDRELCLLAARSYVSLRRYQQAAVVCEQAMRTASDSDAVDALYLSLPAEVLAARLAERFEYVQSANDTVEQIALARVLSDMDPGRKTAAPTMARDLLEQVLKREPRNALAWYHYGRAMTRLEAPDAALDAFDKAIGAGPDEDLRVRILTSIGRRRWSRSQHQAAEEAYRSALSANRALPAHNAESAFDYLLFLKSQSRPGEAQVLLREILSWSPLFPPGRMEMANVLAQRGDWRRVIEQAELALWASEDGSSVRRSAHAILARAYTALGLTADAAPHLAWVEQHP